MKTFKFWCQKVLPLVYDNSLSYYEVLCKVVDYLNNLIEVDKGLIADVDTLKIELEKVKTSIDNLDSVAIERIIRDYIATSVFFGLTDSGYFVAYIPESWNDIKFNTTGVDININGVEFGKLVLSY